jgi:hypothetical protein
MLSKILVAIDHSARNQEVFDTALSLAVFDDQTVDVYQTQDE